VLAYGKRAVAAGGSETFGVWGFCASDHVADIHGIAKHRPAGYQDEISRIFVRWNQGFHPFWTAPPAFDKIVLVLFGLLVKARSTMKRIFTLIVLLGIVMGAVLTGCNQGSETPKPADTNAPPPASTTK
jgi:hypothetical protein